MGRPLTKKTCLFCPAPLGAGNQRGMCFACQQKRGCWICGRAPERAGKGRALCNACKGVAEGIKAAHLHQRGIQPPPVHCLEERIAYYCARAEAGLDLFINSPWKR